MSGTTYWFAGSLVLRFINSLFVNVNNFLRRKSKDTYKVVSNDEIALQAEYICEKYIECRFTRNGKNTKLQVNPHFTTEAINKDICSEEVVKTMQKLGGILENNYPQLYTNVAKQLNFAVNFDLVVCGVFTCVCDNILASGITWAKIVSMYAFAAALADDCCQGKDVRTAKSISRWMGQYTHKRLCGWIREHGGWVSMPFICWLFIGDGNLCV
jgi:hypothetical protein